MNVQAHGHASQIVTWVKWLSLASIPLLYAIAWIVHRQDSGAFRYLIFASIAATALTIWASFQTIHLASSKACLAITATYLLYLLLIG